MYIVPINEAQLKQIIMESVKRTLFEIDDFRHKCKELGSESNISNFSDVYRLYNEINKILNNYDNSENDRKDWDLLHSQEWDSFFNKIKNLPEQLRFYNQDNVSEEDYEILKNFSNECADIDYGYFSFDSSFVEKSHQIINSLRKALNIYGNFIDYFLKKHENSSIKDNDIKSDWEMFDRERKSFLDRNTSSAILGQAFRDIPLHSNEKSALKRYDRAMSDIQSLNNDI